MIGVIAINNDDIIINTSLPEILTHGISSITSNSAISGGKIINQGGSAITARGVCWSTSVNPTRTDNKTIDNSITQNFILNILGLSSNTTYYVRAYATNSYGTGYGNQQSFTTNANIPTTPLIVINSISSISFDSCIINSTITTNEIVSEKGVTYSTSSNPTPTIDSYYNNGGGSGTYISNLSNLNWPIFYYVRAYCVISGNIFLSEQRTFTTINIQIGDYYKEGIVAAIFTTPQNGYRGIIKGNRWLNSYPSPFLIYYRPYSYPLVPFRDGLCSTETRAGYGKIGTQAMLNAYNYTTQASDGIAKIIWQPDSQGNYWHLPTLYDLDEIFKNKVILNLDTYPNGSNYNWYASCSAAQTGLFEPSKFYEYNIQGRPGYQFPWETHDRDNKIIYATIPIKYF